MKIHPLDDGKLVWRFMASETDGLAMLDGHLASVFPISGSVLVLDQTVIAVAGTHTDLGRLYVWALDLATGKPHAKRVLGPDGIPALSNNLTVADPQGNGFRIVSPQGGSYGAGGAYHFDGDQRELHAESSGVGGGMAFDRQGDRI